MVAEIELTDEPDEPSEEEVAEMDEILEDLDKTWSLDEKPFKAADQTMAIPRGLADLMVLGADAIRDRMQELQLRLEETSMALADCEDALEEQREARAELPTSIIRLPDTLSDPADVFTEGEAFINELMEPLKHHLGGGKQVYVLGDDHIDKIKGLIAKAVTLTTKAVNALVRERSYVVDPANDSNQWEGMVRSGTYRHWKGVRYRVYGVGRHSENGEQLVVYKRIGGKEPLSEAPFWARPIEHFAGYVNPQRVGGHENVPRFKRVDGEA